MKFSILCLTGAVLALSASAALAQAPAATRGPGGAEIHPVGDWSVRCTPNPSPSPCDMYEELDNRNTRERVLSVSIAFVPSLDRNGIRIAVPLGLDLASGLVIQTDTFTSPALHYRRCDREGCYVEMPMDAGSIASLSKSGPAAKIHIVADGGKKFDFNFSLNGFAGAYDQMSSLAKQKATKVPPQAPAQQ